MAEQAIASLLRCEDGSKTTMIISKSRFVELIPHAYIHPLEVLLAGAWDVPTAKLALHIRSARINGTAPEPPTYAAIWMDSAGVICGMTLGVN